MMSDDAYLISRVNQIIEIDGKTCQIKNVRDLNLTDEDIEREKIEHQTGELRHECRMQWTTTILKWRYRKQGIIEKKDIKVLYV